MRSSKNLKEQKSISGSHLHIRGQLVKQKFTSNISLFQFMIIVLALSAHKVRSEERYGTCWYTDANNPTSDIPISISLYNTTAYPGLMDQLFSSCYSIPGERLSLDYSYVGIGSCTPSQYTPSDAIEPPNVEFYVGAGYILPDAILGCFLNVINDLYCYPPSDISNTSDNASAIYTALAAIGIAVACFYACCKIPCIFQRCLSSSRREDNLREEKNAPLPYEMIPEDYKIDIHDSISMERKLIQPVLSYPSLHEKPDYDCPITCTIMRNPYTANDGYTYEKEAIITHRMTKQASPLDNVRLLESLAEMKDREGSRIIRDHIHHDVLKNEDLAREFYQAHPDAINNPQRSLGEIDFAKQFKENYPHLMRPALRIGNSPF